MIGPFRLVQEKKSFGSGFYAPWRGAHCYALNFFIAKCHLRNILPWTLLCSSILCFQTLASIYMFYERPAVILNWRMMIWKCENVFQMWLRRLKWPSKVPGGLVWAWSQLLTLTRRWFGWLGKEGGTIGVAQKGHWWGQVEDLRDGQRWTQCGIKIDAAIGEAAGLNPGKPGVLAASVGGWLVPPCWKELEMRTTGC